jgi:MFS family permease
MTEFPTNPFTPKDPKRRKRVVIGTAVTLALVAASALGALCILAGSMGVGIHISDGWTTGEALLVLSAGAMLLGIPIRMAIRYFRKQQPDEGFHPRRAVRRGSTSTRVFSIGIWLLVSGAWITLAVDHPNHPGWVWLSAAVWALAAVFVIRSMKRVTRLKSAPETPKRQSTLRRK